MQTDHDVFREYFDPDTVANIDAFLTEVEDALRRGRTTHYENFIVRLSVLRQNTDPKKAQDSKQRLSAKHSEFSAYKALDKTFYDAPACVHKVLWTKTCSFLGLK